MVIIDIPPYNKRYRGKTYHWVHTCSEYSTFIENRRAAKKLIEEYQSKDEKCHLIRNGQSYLIYIAD